jgi:predicted ATPase
MPDRQYHQSLCLKNFTVFADSALEFVPGINVLIGENGSGKTHVLKTLYAWQMARHLAEKGRPSRYDSLFEEVFRVDSCSDLQRSKRKIAEVSGVFGAETWKLGFQGKSVTDAGDRPNASRPVFIPSLEMMALARNMDGILRDYADFDRTCFDFVSMVAAKERSPNSEVAAPVTSAFRGLLPGSVKWDADSKKFYLESKTALLPFQILAEGERKIAGLMRLLDLGFIGRNSVLLWDEPEVNLNPQWMDELVEQLIEIADYDVQIFVATHSYVILKLLDLTLRKRRLKEGVAPTVRFFALEKMRGTSMVRWSDSFASGRPNPILDQYNDMLLQDMQLEDDEDSVLQNGRA